MALRLENLRKTYAAPDGTTVTVLNVDRFELADGEQAALVGGSGTGKTTLLHAIAGIVTPDGGVCRFGSDDELHSGGGVNVAGLSEAQRDVFRGKNIGYIFQTHHLLQGFTALENVLLGMSFTGRAADKDWARHLLHAVGLSDRLDYVPAKLSVGQQQRVAVARALASRPKLVLADEPTGALDPTNAQQVLSLIRGLATEAGAALLIVTHDLSIANQLPRVVQLAELNRNQLAGASA
ncbi:MAG TPA: ABC transporter ATP-binding protein [Tepidisphaeraceae bacterium]|jgi:putative ABC transport system ATP-binding protein